MTTYHDEDWGVPVEGDAELFERLALESFQAGLSWSTILRKRDAFRAAFEGFEPAVVAAYGPRERERLLADAGDRPPRRQDRRDDRQRGGGAGTNAEFGTFAAYLASSCRAACLCPPNAEAGSIPSSTPESGRAVEGPAPARVPFVGTTIVYAFMQSVGLVDDHLPVCFPVPPRGRDTLAVTGRRAVLRGMITFECAWCEGEMAMESLDADRVECLDCAVTVEIAPDATTSSILSRSRRLISGQARDPQRDR